MPNRSCKILLGENFCLDEKNPVLVSLKISFTVKSKSSTCSIVRRKETHANFAAVSQVAEVTATMHEKCSAEFKGIKLWS